MPQIQSESVVRDSFQNFVNVDSLPQTMAYDGAGNLASVTAGPDARGNFYKQSFTYLNGKLATVSAWVRQ